MLQEYCRRGRRHNLPLGLSFAAPSVKPLSSASSRDAHALIVSPGSCLPPKPFHLPSPKPRFLSPRRTRWLGSSMRNTREQRLGGSGPSSGPGGGGASAAEGGGGASAAEGGGGLLAEAPWPSV